MITQKYTQSSVSFYLKVHWNPSQWYVMMEDEKIHPFYGSYHSASNLLMWWLCFKKCDICRCILFSNFQN